MPAATLDLTGSYIIEQGAIWELTLYYPGNVTGASLRGEIRTNYGGELLARFQFGTGIWDEVTDKTSFRMWIQSGITRKIPVPPADGFHRYDVLFQAAGKEPIRLLQGKVYVSPAITA